MAGPGDDDSGERGEEAHAPRECMACRGSGSVISNLGGTASTVTCPWCRGSGVRLPEGDAQAGWAREQAAEPAADPPTAESSDTVSDAGTDGGDSAA